MKTSELKNLLVGGIIGRVVLTCRHHAMKPTPIWDVYFYDRPGVLVPVCRNFGEQLVNNDGTPKTYTSLDRARVAIRALGYENIIDIDG